MKLSSKLYLLGFFLSFLLVVVGGTGLFYLKKIQNAMVREAAPLIQISGEIIESIREVHHVAAMTPETEEQARELIQNVDESEKAFKEKIGRLAAIAEKADIAFDPLGLETAHGELIAVARDFVNLQNTLVQKEALLDEINEEAENQESALRHLIIEFTNANQAALNEQEDHVKTLAESGDAAVHNMSDLITELFQTNIFFLFSATKLQNYMLQEEEASNEYLEEANPEEFPEIKEEFENAAKLAEDRIRLLKNRVSDANKRNVEAIEKGLSKLVEIKSGEGGLFAAHGARLAAAVSLNDLHTRFDGASVACEQKALQLAGHIDTELMANSRSEVTHAMEYGAAAILIGILAAILGMAIVNRKITDPINEVVAELRVFTEEVAAASDQVANASHSVAEDASEQAASLEETSASLEEMAVGTGRNAENAGKADELMTAAIQSVREANAAVGDLTTSMSEILESSQDASKIVKSINEIAFQTNLLSLNAAVEAARAGEAGAGFAVVAGEVRNLAMRTAEAADETAGIIEATVRKIEAGSALMTRTNDAFIHVDENSSGVAAIVKDITASSREQAQRIEEVKKAVVQLDGTTQRNTMSAEQSASTAREMSVQSDRMQRSVGKMSHLIIGKASHGRPLKRIDHVPVEDDADNELVRQKYPR